MSRTLYKRRKLSVNKELVDQVVVACNKSQLRAGGHLGRVICI